MKSNLSLSRLQRMSRRDVTIWSKWSVPLAISFLILCGCATWSGEIDKNRQHLLKLELGMSETRVIDIMGMPYNKEVLILENGKSIEVFKYQTEYSPAGPIVESELTPICIQDGKVIGWGRKFYYNKKRKLEILYP